MQSEVVPQCRQRVQTREREECIRQISVNILGRLEYRPVLIDSKVEIKKTKMKYSAVENEGHDADDGDDEHQPIEHQVHWA
jgi:hypothetical protein